MDKLEKATMDITQYRKLLSAVTRTRGKGRPPHLAVQCSYQGSTEEYGQRIFRELKKAGVFSEGQGSCVSVSCTRWEEIYDLPGRLIPQLLNAIGLRSSFQGVVTIDLRGCPGLPSPEHGARLGRLLSDLGDKVQGVLLTCGSAEALSGAIPGLDMLALRLDRQEVYQQTLHRLVHWGATLTADGRDALEQALEALGETRGQMLAQAILQFSLSTDKPIDQECVQALSLLPRQEASPIGGTRPIGFERM